MDIRVTFAVSGASTGLANAGSRSHASGSVASFEAASIQPRLASREADGRLSRPVALSARTRFSTPAWEWCSTPRNWTWVRNWAWLESAMPRQRD